MHFWSQMENAQNDDDFQDLFREQGEESLARAIIDAGYNGPLHNILLLKRPDVIRCLALNASILSFKAELDQLRLGLAAAYNSLALISEFPELFKDFFVYNADSAVTPGKTL